MCCRELDTTLGDALAKLPLEARDSAAYRGLCDAVLAFATATLRHRLDDAASVRLLRRFLAALLPAELDDDNSNLGAAPTVTDGICDAEVHTCSAFEAVPIC